MSSRFMSLSSVLAGGVVVSTAVLFFMSALSAYAMTEGEQYARMAQQLQVVSAQVAQLQSQRQAGIVLGASSTVPVFPVCRIATDKNVYKLGDVIKFTWSSTGAVTGNFVVDGSGKDSLTYPNSVSPSGTVNLTANVLGLPTITFKVVSATGHSMTCVKIIAITAQDATKTDIKIAPLQAKLLKLQQQISKLNDQREKITLDVARLQAQAVATQMEIDRTVGTTVNPATSTSNGKAAFMFVGSKETRLVNDPTNPLDDTGEFELTVDVTAVDGDVYLPKAVNRMSFSTAKGMTFRVIDASTGKGTALGTTTEAISSTANSVGNLYKISEGETESMVVKVSYDSTAPGTFKIGLVSSLWSASPTASLQNTALPLPYVQNGGYTSNALSI